MNVQTWGSAPNTHIITATQVDQPEGTPPGTYFQWGCRGCKWDGGIVGYDKHLAGPNNGFQVPFMQADEMICEHIKWAQKEGIK